MCFVQSQCKAYHKGGRPKPATFVLALNKAHVLALNTAHVLRLNKADVLALNKAHVFRLNTKIIFAENMRTVNHRIGVPCWEVFVHDCSSELRWGAGRHIVLHRILVRIFLGGSRASIPP